MTTSQRIAKLEPNTPVKSWRSDKKMVVLAKKGNKTKVIHFGQVGYSDFTKHKDPSRRKNYLKRSAGIRNAKGQLTKNDIFSANYWARKILW
jgi:hypothetical protein